MAAASHARGEAFGSLAAAAWRILLAGARAADLVAPGRLALYREGRPYRQP